MARKTDIVILADGRQVPIRQLGWLQLRASRQARHIADQGKHAQLLIALGGAEEFGKAWKAVREPKPPEAEPADPVPVSEPVPAPRIAADILRDEHDLMTVLIGGIPSWQKEEIEDLDEPDAELLGCRILALSPLANAAPERSETAGNAPEPSIGT